MSKGIRLGSEHRQTRITLPEEPLFHMIADHELDMIDYGTSPHKELTFASGGLTVGLVLPALSGALSVSRTGRIDWIGLTGMCLFFALLAVALISGFTWWRQRRLVARLKARIRSRHDQQLGTIADLDFTQGPG